MNFKQSMKVAAVGALAMMSLSLAGCGQDSAKSANGETQYTVGIVQLVEHNALDAANRGFVDALAERGIKEGTNLQLDRQNAQADQSNLQNIGQRFVSNKVDLIYAIATPAAQTVANLTKDIPIVASAVTDFEQAKLVRSNDAPGGNVTGTSDMNPIPEQIDLLLKIVPDAKTIGTIYTSSEVNSEIQVAAMKKYAESKGLTVEVVTISTVNDLQQAAESLVGKVDAFYEPTDNIVASAMPTLVAVTTNAKKTVIGGEPYHVEGGALATYGIDYYELGKQAGSMAADILEGKSAPAAMSVQFAKTLKVYINTTTAANLGITLPEDVLSAAEKIK